MTVLETAGISVSFLRNPLTTAVNVGHQLAAIELEIIGGERDVGALALQDVDEPMGELDIAVAGALGLAQRLEKGLVADPVELACDRLKADVGHRFALLCSAVCRARLRLCLIRSAG